MIVNPAKESKINMTHQKISVTLNAFLFINYEYIHVIMLTIQLSSRIDASSTPKFHCAIL